MRRRRILAASGALAGHPKRLAHRIPRDSFSRALARDAQHRVESSRVDCIFITRRSRGRALAKKKGGRRAAKEQSNYCCVSQSVHASARAHCSSLARPPARRLVRFCELFPLGERRAADEGSSLPLELATSSSERLPPDALSQTRAGPFLPRRRSACASQAKTSLRARSGLARPARLAATRLLFHRARASQQLVSINLENMTRERPPRLEWAHSTRATPFQLVRRDISRPPARLGPRLMSPGATSTLARRRFIFSPRPPLSARI